MIYTFQQRRKRKKSTYKIGAELDKIGAELDNFGAELDNF